jgi:hypothetical protein
MLVVHFVFYETRNFIVKEIGAFWNVTPYGSCKNRRFSGTYHLHHRREAILSSETSVLTRTTWCNILEDGIPLSHRRETLKSYIALISWTL